MLKTKLVILFLISVYLPSCSLVKDPVHDEDLLANEAKNIWEKLLFDVDAKPIYLSASDSFKKKVTFTRFEFFVDYQAYNFEYKKIEIYGYEYGRTQELERQVVVYAKGESPYGISNLMLQFTGSKEEGYTFDYIAINTDKVKHEGIYENFPKPTPVGESKVLSRKVQIDDSNSIRVEFVNSLFNKNNNKDFYELTYVTDVSIYDQAKTEIFARKVLLNYAGVKARSIDLNFATMVAMNQSVIESVSGEAETNKTTFKYQNGKWVIENKKLPE